MKAGFQPGRGQAGLLHLREGEVGVHPHGVAPVGRAAPVQLP